jgi:FixJ family two-component response regulator
VEDDFRTRKALRALLEAYDMTVRDYASADAFLAETGRPKMGCLILDLHMHGMTGLDLLRLLRSRGRVLPVIVMTGDPSLREQADHFGASAFLEKPVATEVLSLTVRKALSRIDHAL